MLEITSEMNSLLAKESIVDRDKWKAKPPKKVLTMQSPAQYVVIHHTSAPYTCRTKEECCKAMRSMQDYHQSKGAGKLDIAYSLVFSYKSIEYKIQILMISYF